MAALRVLPPDALRRRGRVDPADRRADPAAAGRRRGLRRRRTTSTSRSRADPALRRGVAAGPRADAARSSPSAAATPTGPARRTRSTACVWRAERPGRAGLGQRRSAAAAPAGTSSARRSRWSTSASTSTSRAAAATWSSRTTRCAPSEAQVRRRAAPFARAYVHAGMVGYDGEKMSKSQGQPGASSRALRDSERRPDGDPAGAAAPPLPLRLGVDRRPSCGAPSTRLDRWRRALALGAGAPGRRRWSTRSLAALADDLDAPAALAAVDALGGGHARARRAGRHQRPGGGAAIRRAARRARSASRC